MPQQPTLIDVMPSRLDGIRDAVLGYRETGVPLVSFDGSTFGSAGAGSDVGMFFFVPKISAAFGLQPAAATDAFLLGVLLAGFATGAVACLLLFRRPLQRGIALTALLLVGLVSFLVGDQYVIAPALTVAIVPLFLYLRRQSVREIPLAAFLLIAGIAIGLAHVTRAHAGTAIVLFITIAMLFTPGREVTRRVLLLVPLLVGSLIGPLYFHQLVTRRDAYLAQRQPDRAAVYPAHPLWHSVYIGFGFLSNRHVPAYRDEVAVARVEAVAPGTAYVSREYERVLRAEVFRLVVDQPFFVASTLFAKLGVLALYLLTFANVGLLAAFTRPNGQPIEAAFWAALAFSSLHGLLVVPWATYLSGFIAFAALYGFVSLNAVLEVKPLFARKAWTA